MDPSHKKLIRKHLPELIQNTVCLPKFLTRFNTNRILSSVEVGSIKVEGERKGVYHQSKLFYDILLSNSKGYSTLLQALRETHQTGVLEIFQSSESDSSTSRFIKKPFYLSRFLQDGSKKALIICTEDCEITCERISDPSSSSDCLVCGLEDLQQLDLSEKKLKKYLRSNFLVINCGGESISQINFDALSKIKLVLVTSKTKRVVRAELASNNTTTKHVNLEEDKINWGEVNPIFQKMIKRNIEHYYELQETAYLPFLAQLDIKTFIQLVSRRKPELFHKTLPQPIEYYILRRIRSRQIPEDAIFKNSGQDIFLFKNIERWILSEKMMGSGTITSTKLLLAQDNKDMVHRFIVLEDDKHFDQIHDIFKCRPLHLLRYENQKFIWEKSVGNFSNRQNPLEASQLIFNETDLLAHIKTEKRSSKYPICISDVAGMGKSTLLAHLGRELQNEMKDGLVAFIDMNDFVKRVKKVLKEKRDFEAVGNATIKVLINNCLVRTPLGIAFIERHQKYLKELLLDGFDEIGDESDMLLGFNCLKAIQRTFENTRIWIGTRPHVFAQMERRFKVSMYNILAFDRDDQINFLKCYWSSRNNGNNNEFENYSETLGYFANEVVNNVSTAFRESQEDFSGIPLQCHLIGEVFSETAKRFCLSDNEHEDIPDMLQFPPGTKPMFRLYEKLVQKLFSKFYSRYDANKVDSSLVWQAHYYRSISLLFPSFKTPFKSELSNVLSDKQLVDVGFMEMVGLKKPRFIHRTFADFFFAVFVVESLQKNRNMFLLELLYTVVLDTKLKQVKFKNLSIDGWEFRQDSICYFIDGLLGNADIDFRSIQCICCIPAINKMTKFVTFSDQTTTANSLCDYKRNQINSATLQRIAQACALNNFDNIFSALLVDASLGIGDPNLGTSLYTTNFLILATICSNTSMVRKAYENYTRSSDSSLNSVHLQNHTLLHLAVSRGDVATVQLLLSKDKFLNWNLGDYKCMNLLSICLLFSKFEDAGILQKKKEIISLLANKSRDIFITDKMALWGSDVSVDLVIQILHCAPELYRDDDQLLYQIISHFVNQCNSPDQYLRLLETVLANKSATFFTNFLVKKVMRTSLVKKIILGMEPHTKLLIFLETSDLILQADLEEETSLLDMAIELGRGLDCLSWLLDNTKLSTAELKQKLFLAMDHLNYQAIEILLEQPDIDPNLQREDNDGNTLLHSLFKPNSIMSQTHYKIAQFLFSANVHLQTFNKSFKLPINDNLVSTRYSIHGLHIFELLETSSEEFGMDRCHFLKLKWLFNNFNEIDESILFEQLEKSMMRLKGVCQISDPDGNTLFHLAASIGSLPALKLLKKAGSCLNSTNNKRNTPLHLLASSSRFSIEAWKYLVQNGASANVVHFNKAGSSPICILAARKAHILLEALRHVLMEIYPSNLSSKDYISKIDKILLVVIWRCPLAIVMAMCDWYRKVNTKKLFNLIECDISGDATTIATPLYTALLSYDIAKLSYVSGTLRCTKIVTPLPRSCIHKYIQMDEVTIEERLAFIQFVARLYPHLINIKDEQGKVPLAVRGIDPRLVKRMIALGARINSTDAAGNSPLHWALIHNQPNAHLLVQTLVECCANVNGANLEHKTPLDLTLQMVNKQEMIVCIKILVNRNANNARKISLTGDTFLHQLGSSMVRTGYHNIVKFLLEKGFADLFKVANIEGHTPIQIARRYFREPLEHRTVELFRKYEIVV